MGLLSPTANGISTPLEIPKESVSAPHQNPRILSLIASSAYQFWTHFLSERELSTYYNPLIKKEEETKDRGGSLLSLQVYISKARQ